MKKARLVRKLFYGTPTLEGAGVRLRRYFSSDEVKLFDPFLLLDDFSGRQKSDYEKGFPWHPHRGIETITYVLTGAVEHADSLGNKGSIGSGDLQWMTAGSGIIHQEMPRGDGNGHLSGLQLWANLPAAKKMIDPRYRDLSGGDVPVVHGADKSLYRIIAGEMDGVHGPVRDIAIRPTYFDISMPAGTEFVYPTPGNHTFFAYVIQGNGSFGELEHPATVAGSGAPEEWPASVPERTVVLFTDGSFISIATGATPVRFLLIGGEPLREPVAWYGPIVMNTDEELRKAFEEFQVGTFIKHGKSSIPLI